MTAEAHAARAAARAPSGARRRRVPLEAFVHLVWLLFLGFQPIFDPTAGVRDALVIVGIVAVFLPVYFWTWSRPPGRAALPGIAVLGVMGALLPAVNSGATTFLVYAAAAAGTKLQPRFAVGVLAVLVAAALVGAWTSGIPWPYVVAVYTPAVLLTPMIGAVTLFDGVRSRANARLLRAQDEIERLATIAERERIARDLHDLLGHTLSVIVLKSELAAKLADRDAVRAATEIRDVERISRRALGEVREAVVRYRQRGLAAELDEARAAFDAAVGGAGRGAPRRAAAAARRGDARDGGARGPDERAPARPSQPLRRPGRAATATPGCSRCATMATGGSVRSATASPASASGSRRSADGWTCKAAPACA